MQGCVVRLHSVLFGGDLSAQPIKINFRQLFRTTDAPEILPSIKNEDVLRAVVALLDTHLPDVGPRDVHETVHCPGVQTLILARDHADVLEEYRGKRPRIKGRCLVPVPCTTAERAERDSTHNLLSKLYSDSEESQGEISEESSEETSEEDTNRDMDIEAGVSEWRARTKAIERWSWDRFRDGLQEFVEGARNRREIRKREVEEIPASAIGAESLIMAAACYEFKSLSTGDTALQLSLLAVRKRFWHLGIGGYIMKLLKTQSMVGQYDVLVVHADSDAVGFFKGHELTDDLMLNDKYKELKDDWTNSILMSYLPPFTTDLQMRNPGFSLNFTELEMDLQIAGSQALSAYQQQMICVTRLIREVKTLRTQLDTQREVVERLHSRLEHERQTRRKIEHRFLMYKLKNAKQLLGNTESDSDAVLSLCFPDVQEDDNHEHLSTEEQEVEQSDEPSIQTPEGANCSYR
nr:uncharacterized protein si:dkeyp-50b9.1 isoform X2 [Misgurnus anguillicaudatus]